MNGDPGSAADPAAAARERVRSAHAAAVAGVGECADGVAARWPGRSTADAAAVAGPLREALAGAGLRDRFPGVLASAVAAAGADLAAEPVPAPPYVAVTSRGPVLRGALAEGRLVVRLDAFAVERGDGDARYVRHEGDPGVAVRAALRGRERTGGCPPGKN